jgi:hypothetical protein
LLPISGVVVDPARWMTLLEALEHIQSSEKCDPVAAQVDLKHEIGHRVIPVKWADSEGPDDKPDVSELQRSQLVLSGPGLALSGQSLRPLLVFRPSVHATWPRTISKVTTSPEEANSNGARDPAQRKAEEKYEQWMSLVEAIERIRMSPRCDSIEALRQLKREVNDGMVQVQWEDSDGPKDSPDPKYLQGAQLLLIGTGFAPDNVQKIYRPLLVERSAVRELWPLSNHRPKDSHQANSRPAHQPRQQRRPASKSQIRQVLKEIYADPTNDRPNEEDAWKLLQTMLPNAKRSMVREVLREDEFASQRRPRGNQPKG